MLLQPLGHLSVFRINLHAVRDRLSHTAALFPRINSITFEFSDLERADGARRQRLCKTSSSPVIICVCRDANTKSRIHAAIAFGYLPAQSHTIKPFGEWTTISKRRRRLRTPERAIEFRPRTFARRQLVLAMFVLWAINACVIERFQATRRVAGVSNLTCAGILAGNTSLCGVEVKHVRDEQTRDPLIDFCRRCSRSHRISSRLLEAGEADHVVESITGTCHGECSSTTLTSVSMRRRPTRSSADVRSYIG